MLPQAGLWTAALICCGLAAADTPAVESYALRFRLALERGNTQGAASLQLSQNQRLLREARFRAPEQYYEDFRGDGSVSRDGQYVTWQPPAAGGTLHYVVNIQRRRDEDSFESYVSDDWALFRGDDIFPPAHIRQLSGSGSLSWLELEVPDEWSVVTPFPRTTKFTYRVENPDRKFDRPVGWIIAGKLGVRRDKIAGIAVAVAAPIGAGVERISMLALLRWTLPMLVGQLESTPAMLSVVAAGDPMWRGGLSAPNSIFVHANRPLLSENGTSTLLHEVVHVLMPVPAAPDQDWIDEGIAEYLCLRVLRDTGTISDARFTAAVDGFRRRSGDIDDIAGSSVAGERKARAVVIFHDLDMELQQQTGGQVDLFDLSRQLMSQSAPVDLDVLRALARDLVSGDTPAALLSDRVRGAE